MANGDLNFQGLLSDPGFNLGIGLLGAGLSRPQSFGQGLLSGFQSAGTLQGRALENQVTRDALAASSRQRQAQQQLADQVTASPEQRSLGLISQAGGQPGPTQQAAQLSGLLSQGDDPQRRQMLGLLAEANPQAFTQAMTQQAFPQERSQTSLVRNLQAAGVAPNSEQGREIILNTLTRDPGVTDQQLALLQTQLRAMQVQQMQREMQREERTEEQRRGQLITDLRSDLNQAEELAQLNERLQGTALETGLPFTELRRGIASGVDAVKRLIGGSDEEAQSLIADFDRFNKLATDFAVGSATRMFDQGGITNFQLQSIQDAQVSPGVAPSANARVIADNIEALLAGADNLDIDIKDRSRFEALAQDLRGESPQRREEAPRNGRSMDFDQMSLDELGRLNTRELSDEQLLRANEAFRRKAEEVRSGQR